MMNKFVFGITGGTGAGKSTVSKMLADKGVKVIDADKVARIVMEKGTPCLNELTEVFGCEILDSDGCLNRSRLASIVFNDKNKLEILNKISHKYIKEYIEAETEKSEAELTAIDGAVIIGSPVMDLCKKLVVVTADENIRLKRITDRDNITEKAAKERISSQMSSEEYEKFADYIIKNNGNHKKLGEEIERIYGEIKNSSTSESTKT